MTDQSTPAPKLLLLTPLAALIGVSAFFGILFDYFFYDKPLGIAFPLYVVLGLLAFLSLVALFQRWVHGWTVALLLAVTFFAAMVSVRASPQLTALNLGLTFYLAILTVREFIGRRLADHTIMDYLWAVLDPLEYLHHTRTTVTTTLEAAGVQKDSPVARQIIRGLGFAVLAIVVFILLFTSADQVFQEYVENIFEMETLLRILSVFVIAIGLVSVFGKLFLSRPHEKTDKPVRTARLGTIEVSILLWSVNIIFFLFLLVQLVYFFGGDQNISYAGLTYSKYARKGFFELLTVGVIAFLLLWKAEQEVVKREHKHTVAFQAASTVMIAQVLLVLVSAFMRLMLYEEVYGFTVLRFYSHAFTIWLGIVFVILLVKVLVDHRENTFAFRVFVSAVAFAVALNIVNPDAFIVRENFELWVVKGKPADEAYIARLSDDIMPAVQKLVDMGGDAESFADRIIIMRKQRDLDPNTQKLPWQSFHFAHERAKSVMKTKIIEPRFWTIQ